MQALEQVLDTGRLLEEADGLVEGAGDGDRRAWGNRKLNRRENYRVSSCCRVEDRLTHGEFGGRT